MAQTPRELTTEETCTELKCSESKLTRRFDPILKPRYVKARGSARKMYLATRVEALKAQENGKGGAK